MRCHKNFYWNKTGFPSLFKNIQLQHIIENVSLSLRTLLQLFSINPNQLEYPSTCTSRQFLHLLPVSLLLKCVVSFTLTYRTEVNVNCTEKIRLVGTRQDLNILTKFLTTEEHQNVSKSKENLVSRWHGGLWYEGKAQERKRIDSAPWPTKHSVTFQAVLLKNFIWDGCVHTHCFLVLSQVRKVNKNQLFLLGSSICTKKQSWSFCLSLTKSEHCLSDSQSSVFSGWLHK